MAYTRHIIVAVTATLLTQASFSWPLAAGPTDREGELEQLRQLVTEVQPAAAELAGFEVGEPVEVDLKSREEIREYMIRMVEISNPDGDLYRRGRCLARIGLLPEGYDLEAGMVDLVAEQAGGLYDPFSKEFWGLVNMQSSMAPYYQRLIASHELTHALQDRVTDIVALLDDFLENPDYEFAFRSVIEGMATVVMFAYTQDLGVDDVPDTRRTMRIGFGQKAADPSLNAYASSPEYVRELLISPYAEGGAFVQAWLRANPDMELAALMNNIPASSEQILHPEKYLTPDAPTAVDLSSIDMRLPETWVAFYTAILGEFDLLTLFSIHEETREAAAGLAAGWDGLRFRAFERPDGQIVLLGSSVWDSEQDAAEFRVGFSTVLAEINGPEGFEVVQSGESVDFVIGSPGYAPPTGLLEIVQSAARPSDVLRGE